MDEVKLLPCPFDGGQAVRCFHVDDPTRTRYWILCRDCHACPGDKLTEAEAIAAWNTRPTTVVTGEGQGEVEPRPNFAEFSQALLIAAGFYSDVELAFWLTAPQPLLEMYTPVQLLARGDGPKLLQVMQQLDDGVYI